jgi:hypothetical protein
MEDYIIAMAVTIVLATIKNPSKKAKLKSAMQKIYNAIGAAYPEFK